MQSTAGWEEYTDYVFPDDNRALGGLKLMENAAKWKAGLLNMAGAASAVKRKAEELEEDEDGGAAPSKAPTYVQDDAELNIDDA